MQPDLAQCCILLPPALTLSSKWVLHLTPGLEGYLTGLHLKHSSNIGTSKCIRPYTDFVTAHMCIQASRSGHKAASAVEHLKHNKAVLCS